jgi:hypothetical protein
MALLQAHSLCQHAEIVETKVFSFEQFFFKIRAELTGVFQFQVRIYYNHGHIDYAYQLFTDVPLMRWDNKEEFPHLESYPHHHHDRDGKVTVSPLKGKPIEDLKIVLHQLQKELC